MQYVAVHQVVVDVVVLVCSHVRQQVDYFAEVLHRLATEDLYPRKFLYQQLV